MIDKLFGRDNTEELTEEPVEEPAEMSVPQKKKSGLSITIKGLWTDAARDYDPKTEITVPENVGNIFYRIESTGSGFGEQRHLTKVYANGRMIVLENGTIKEGDSTDTSVIDLPSTFKEPGAKVTITIVIESWDGKVLYVSPEFLVNVQ